MQSALLLCPRSVDEEAEINQPEQLASAGVGTLSQAVGTESVRCGCWAQLPLPPPPSEGLSPRFLRVPGVQKGKEPAILFIPRSTPWGRLSLILLCDLGKSLALSGLGFLISKRRKVASTIPHLPLGSNSYDLESSVPEVSS